MIFFTIVSETLISAILSGIPSDPRVVTAVRELVADHAQDEGRHHAYFSRLLEFTWPRLSKAQRALIGPLLPEMILAFLEPDFVAIAGNLRACGLTAEQIDQVMTESYPPATVSAGIRVGVAGDDPALRARRGRRGSRARPRRLRQGGCGRRAAKATWTIRHARAGGRAAGPALRLRHPQRVPRGGRPRRLRRGT